MTSIYLSMMLLAQQSAPTTRLPARLALTAGMFAIIAAIYLLMLRSWRRRRRDQQYLPQLLPALPDEPAPEALFSCEGIYASTTPAGRWMERIVAQGLGVRSEVRVVVRNEGVSLHRRGAQSFLIPSDALSGADSAAGIAGKVVGGDGIAVIDWTWGDSALTTGVRIIDPEVRRGLIETISGLVST
jgi:hypothetical protein